MPSTPSGTITPAITPAQLPSTGAGGPPVSSVSIVVLLLLSAVAFVAGAIAALLGWRVESVEYEDDGITVA